MTAPYPYVDWLALRITSLERAAKATLSKPLARLYRQNRNRLAGRLLAVEPNFLLAPRAPSAEDAAKKHPNGIPMFAPDGTMMTPEGTRSIFDDVDL